LELPTSECDEYIKLSAVNAHPSHGFVGGSEIKANEFPHVSSVGWRSGNEIIWRCGASLISERFCLCAAHCSQVEGVKPTIVRVGDKNLERDDDGANPQQFDIKAFIKHPNYSSRSKHNDIALIELATRAIFTRDVHPACLFQSQSVEGISQVQGMGWGAVGFGMETSNELLQGTLQLYDKKECSESYTDVIIESQICAGDPEMKVDTW